MNRPIVNYVVRREVEAFMREHAGALLLPTPYRNRPRRGAWIARKHGFHWLLAIPRKPIGYGRQWWVDNLEIWLLIAGADVMVRHLRGRILARSVIRRCRNYYVSDLAHPAHSNATRLDLEQSLAYAVLNYAGASDEERDYVEHHYDIVACALRYEAKNDRQ